MLIMLSVFALVLVFIPKNTYINTLSFVSEYFDEESELNYKITDLANYFESEESYETENTGISYRVDRYPLLIETFRKSPIFGCYYNTDSFANGYQEECAHLHWMNKLTVTGIIGIIIFLFILYMNIAKNLNLLNPEYKNYYLIASLTIIVYGFMKVIIGRDIWLAFFVILPGLNYLPLLKKK